MYLLDSYHCMYLLAGDSQITKQLTLHSKAPVITSQIVYDELEWMALRSLHPRQNYYAVQALGRILPIYGIYSKTIQQYRLIKKALEPRLKGHWLGLIPPISVAEHNLWIAASALQLGATLVSRDPEFDHIQKAAPLLRTERWRVEM